MCFEPRPSFLSCDIKNLGEEGPGNSRVGGREGGGVHSPQCPKPPQTKNTWQCTLFFHVGNVTKSVCGVERNVTAGGGGGGGGGAKSEKALNRNGLQRRTQLLPKEDRQRINSHAADLR